MTSNVIYALTCPCGQYDYIDSTAMDIRDRILGKLIDVLSPLNFAMLKKTFALTIQLCFAFLSIPV